MSYEFLALYRKGEPRIKKTTEVILFGDEYWGVVHDPHEYYDGTISPDKRWNIYHLETGLLAQQGDFGITKRATVESFFPRIASVGMSRFKSLYLKGRPIVNALPKKIQIKVYPVNHLERAYRSM